MTTDPETTQPPEPTRNPPGVAFDLALLLAGTYVTARAAGRLLKRVGQAGAAASLSSTALTVFLLALGVGVVALAVPALQSNLRRVPRDGHGRPLPQRGAEGGERGDQRQ